MNLLTGSGALDPWSLFASIIWGALGSGMFIYGWKQKSVLPLSAGLILAGMTYFIESAVLMSVIGAATLGGMYWLKKQGY